MSLEHPSGETVLTAIIAAVSGGGLMKIVDAFAGRKNREVKALGDAIGTLSAQLEAADTRMDKFGERLDDCHALHDACERGRKEDRAEIENLKAQVRRYLSGELPAYHLNAPKGDPGRGEGQ